MTKYLEEKHKFENNRDIISISNESLNSGVADTRTFYCSICRRPLIKLSNYVGGISQNVSYYCENGCTTNINPVEEELRSKSKLMMSEGTIEEPAASHPPDPDAAFYNKNKPVFQGGVKTLADKGMKITNYSDSAKNKGWRITRLGKRDNENG